MARPSQWLRSYHYEPREAAFTPMQWAVAQFVACGLSDKDIGRLFAISASTVKAHNAKTLKALGFTRRTQLVRYIFERQGFDPAGAEAFLSTRQRKAPREASR